MTYIVPAVDHVLRRGSGNGIQAIVVYPMNALANSQDEELRKFLEVGYGEGQSPVRFARYTGQEKGDERKAIRDNPPDILLTNYMMLELLLTRSEDRALVKAAQDLKFLVFDELHTYRGRQGADVALLIRRCRQAFGGKDIICVGTSATMASGGTSEEQSQAVASVAKTLFGTAFDTSQVIGETLERATPERDWTDPASMAALSAAVTAAAEPPEDYVDFKAHPVASWIESTFGVRAEPETGRLIRQIPRPMRGSDGAAEALAALTLTTPAACEDVLRRFLMKGSGLYPPTSSRFPTFAFRLHQFFTRADTVWSTIEPEATRHLEMSKLGSKPGEEDTLMYPLVFCRNCGTAYYRVSVQSDEKGSVLHPREDRRAEGDDGQGDAYLYLSETDPWPRGAGADVLARLPEIMKIQSADGTERVDPVVRSGRARADFRTAHRADRGRRRWRGGGADPQEFPVLPAPRLRRRVHASSEIGARQAQHSRCRQPQHSDHDSRGALADRTAGRQFAQEGSAQAAVVHRQPAGCLAAGGALQ